MKHNRVSFLLFFLAAAVVAGLAQSPARPESPPQPQPIQSPEVQPDHRVTFRFRDPNAKEVMLNREGGKPAPMQKDAQGVWSMTTDPLDPHLYAYPLLAERVSLIDPSH